MDNPQISLNELKWLEAVYDAKAIEWAKVMTRQSIERLEELPIYEQVKQDLSKALSGSPPEPTIVLAGPRAVRFLVTQAQPHGQLQVAERDADGVPGAWRTVLDMGALREQSGIGYELQSGVHSACLLPDGNRCLLSLSPGGGDAVEIREFDLDRGEFIQDGFEVPKTHAYAQWLNTDLVLIGHTLNSPQTQGGLPTTFRLWRRGQALQDAPVVYEGKSTDVLLIPYAAGTGASRYGVIARVIDYSSAEIRVVSQDGRIEKAALPSGAIKAEMSVTIGLGSRALFVQLTQDANIAGRRYAANTLLSYAVDPSIPVGDRVSAVCTLGDADYLDGPDGGLTATRDHVVFVVNHRLVPKVMLGTLKQGVWSVQPLLQAEPGQAINLLMADVQSNDVIVTSSGFVTPGRQVLCRPGVAARVLVEDPVRFEGSHYTTEIRSAKSKDGTEIDYFLLKPRVSPWEGSQPLLVTGYAAFGISFAPSYFGAPVGGPALKLWLDRGGSLLIPAARGGGERGDAWHRAAMLKQRQNSYDDFIAVIQQLVDSGYTEPARIGVVGTSNGGLLAAVLATQRPDLFAAVVSNVPLTDMVRMKYMGKGPAWLGEYGDPADPKMAKVLESYSPLQNIKAGVCYPPFFVSTSTEDNRTGPGHARKLAARLQSVGSPVYYYEQTEGGHGVSDAFRNSELMALRMTFLIDRLIPPGSVAKGQA